MNHAGKPGRNADELNELALLIARKLQSESPSKPSALAAFNSPFVVTVIGGLLLWAVSAFWQANEQSARLQRDAAGAMYERRRALIVEFADSVPTTIALARDFKIRELWISANKDETSEPALFPDRRSFVETRDMYETLRARYGERKSVFAFSAEIPSLFESEDTAALAAKMSDHMQRLLGANGPDARTQIRVHVGELDGVYAQLIGSMSDELTASQEQSR